MPTKSRSLRESMKLFYARALTILLLQSFFVAQAQNNNTLPTSRRGAWDSVGEIRLMPYETQIANTNNILNYGADTRDTTGHRNHRAITDALSEISTREYTLLYIPAGTYIISRPVRIRNKKRIIIAGEGAEKTRLIFDFDSLKNAKCFDIGGSKSIGIENLYLQRREWADFGDMFFFDADTSCWLAGIESSRAPSTHVHILRSKNILVTGCHIHHAWNYGVGGHGYGVVIGSYSSQCLIENNIFNHLRHSVILSNGPSSNIIGYNYSTDPYTTETYLGISDWPSDMCLHGHPNKSVPGPDRNLFEGNICAFMHADDAWYDNGPFNTYFRNRATYYGLRIHRDSPDQNIIANEVDDSDGQLNDILFGDFFWNALDIESDNNFVLGNTNFDPSPPKYPSSSEYSADLSLYLDPNSLPSFLQSLDFFPPIGVVDKTHRGGGTIPAKIRWDSDSARAVAVERSHSQHH